MNIECIKTRAIISVSCERAHWDSIASAGGKRLLDVPWLYGAVSEVLSKEALRSVAHAMARVAYDWYDFLLRVSIKLTHLAQRLKETLRKCSLTLNVVNGCWFLRYQCGASSWREAWFQSVHIKLRLFTMEGWNCRLSIRWLKTLVSNCLDGHIDVRFSDLDSLELFILKVQWIYFINNVCWFIGITAYSSEVFLSIISLILSLVSVYAGSNWRLSNTWISWEVTIYGIRGRFTVSLPIQVLSLDRWNVALVSGHMLRPLIDCWPANPVLSFHRYVGVLQGDTVFVPRWFLRVQCPLSIGKFLIENLWTNRGEYLLGQGVIVYVKVGHLVAQFSCHNLIDVS